MNVNLFPAVLLAGPPHRGKSVLAYLLTAFLKEQKIAHYLLRAVPDGEGNWYMVGEAGLARALRSLHKGSYSSGFVSHMLAAVENRLVPLLVDIGGKPQGEQWDILGACTHYVLLYGNESELSDWQEKLRAMNLQPVAELRSELFGDDQIQSEGAVLQATISSLHRELELRRSGVTFQALAGRIAGICHYEYAYLEHIHRQYAPHTLLSERLLAEQIGLPPERAGYHWRPEDLMALPALKPPPEPLALYGRGPVWLAAALAGWCWPEPLSIFDIRYGWMAVPEVHDGSSEFLETHILSIEDCCTWLQILLPWGILEAEDLQLSAMPDNDGLMLSGKLPRWAFAALTRHYMNEKEWIGVDDPNKSRVVVVHSRSPQFPLGSSFPRPAAAPR